MQYQQGLLSVSGFDSVISGSQASYSLVNDTPKTKPAGSRKRGVTEPKQSGKSVDTVDAVLKAFNTWSYKREQPSDLGALTRVVSLAVAAARPVPFVLYWGKGPRHAIDTPDLACLDYLAGLAHRIRHVYAPGAAVRLIFTDTHATLNGHARADMNAYFDAVDAAARSRGFTSARLGDIVAFAREIGEIAIDETPSEDVLESLVACAAKWYRGEGSSERGALDYYQMNMVEKRAVETSFPEAVFVTFNGGEFRDLFPANMPIFYMYSLRRGFGVKPWFMSSAVADAVPVS